MGEMKEGLVIKGIGGFYYVQCGDVLHACRARGKFRKDKISPYAGDRVRIEVDANDEGYVQEILPRKNFLVRPPLANLDKLFVVSSVCDPQPSTLIIDKTIAAAELKGIEPVLVFTKTDLSDTTELKDIYGSIGIRCYFVSSADGVGVDDLRPELTGCISAFTGNSGVGKSTLLNLLVPELELATGETSKKLGRGRHTTRHVELYPVEGGYVAEVFSAFVASPEESGSETSPWALEWKDSGAYTTWLSAIQERSVIETGVSVTSSDKVLTLSTCTNGGADRFIVMGRLVAVTE